MAKKVRYGVAYEAYGYATTTVPDSVQTRGQLPTTKVVGL